MSVGGIIAIALLVILVALVILGGRGRPAGGARSGPEANFGDGSAGHGGGGSDGGGSD